MIKIASQIFKNHHQAQIVLACFALLFMIAPFYSHQNQGWPLLALPYNTSAWSIISWIVGAAAFIISSQKQFIYPRLWLLFIIFPASIILSSLLADTSSPIDWLFRQLYILGGMLFFFALFQFHAKQKLLDDILLILVIACGLQALLSVMQIVAPANLPLWLSKQPNSTVPRGMFQQVNVLASFLATGLVVSLYSISRPSFYYRTKVVRFFVVMSFALSVYVIIASGSRVGLLAMLLSLPLVVFSRYQQLRKYKVLLTLIVITSLAGVVAGQTGLQQTMDKSVQLTDSGYSAARLSMYTIGIELAAKEPLHGYGIGGFLTAWNTQSSDFYARHPNATLPLVINHPHNEVLLWVIEGGLLVATGIFTTILGIIIALYYCGYQRGGAYAAMLIPISLHTQVEHPFYTSSLHWFLWLFLIYLALQHQTRTIDTKFSEAAKRLIQVVAIFTVIGTTMFMLNTARAESDLFQFIYKEDKKPPYLELALKNIYTKPRAEQVAMRSLLYASIENNDRAKIEMFEAWALDYIKTKPELKMYEDLITASAVLRPEGRGCDAIAAGHAMYAHVKPLQVANEKCK